MHEKSHLIRCLRIELEGLKTVPVVTVTMDVNAGKIADQRCLCTRLNIEFIDGPQPALNGTDPADQCSDDM
jgi:hypothetical protein